MQLFIYGVVQGVGFRPTVYKVAKSLECNGYVRNNGSNVEVCIDKDPQEFIKLLKQELPPLARIDKIESIVSDCHKGYDDFTILHSEKGARSSSIPADTALCDDCLQELFDEKDRRFSYPFTNCTNCGARFSLISDVPYDRVNTSMNEFELCQTCTSEYSSPMDRRHHAQTISCPDDGPFYTLYNRDGEKVDTGLPIQDFAKLLDEGALGIVKSWGGMHIVCKLSEIGRLRDWYKRPAKPFAVMVKDLQTAEKYAILDHESQHHLQSPQRPITLVMKKETSDLDEELQSCLELVSPGLNNIGLYLPYSGIQYLLFQYLKDDALVMTSANPAGEPLIIDNNDALKLGLDAYLLHNRRIINRVDDSLLIPFKDQILFIRKSRGYIPDSIVIDYDTNIITIGAERNVTSSISRGNQLFTSQYIGNINYYNTLQFLRSGTEYLIELLGVEKIDAVGIDLHPQYPSRGFGKELSEKYGVDLYDVQHHWSHATSLMLDAGIQDPILALTCDGAGYGPDGVVWGGEVLYTELTAYERLGSFEEMPLIGGDAATKDPKRLVFGIFEQLGISDLSRSYFDEKTNEILSKLLPSSPRACSLGRILDALACFIEISPARTYDGEPAMRTERYLAKGELKYDFTTEIQNKDRKIVRTLPLFEQLHEQSKNIELADRSKADLAYSFVYCLMKNFVNVGIEAANEKGVKYIGFTGGVSYNLPIMNMVKQFVEDSGLTFLTHNRVPNGDGGISVGQNVIVGHLLNR